MSFLQVKLLDPKATAPTVAHPGEDLAYDLYALEDTELRPNRVAKVRTGIAAAAFGLRTQQTPWGLESKGVPLGLIIKDRSSMGSKEIYTHAGVIDPGFRGEIVVLLSNENPDLHIEYTANGYGGQEYTTSRKGYQIKAGDKIAQMVPIEVRTGEVSVVDELPEALRGEKGFGSSGR